MSGKSGDSRSLVYDVVTPALNEAANLPRLAEALAAQTVPPRRWTIVDTGSTDSTVEIARELGQKRQWVQVISSAGTGRSVRGRPIVLAIQAAGAASAAAGSPDVFVNVDADISFDPDYFERLLAAFMEDPRLGIVSGRCRELDGGIWRVRNITRSCVWGATRAYRWECYTSVLPLDERLGWDGIDEIKANARGWRTGTIPDLFFLHHRPEGVRDGALRSRREQGRTAYYMGYRPWYLVLRALRHAVKEPSAVAMVWGFATSAIRREPKCDDLPARAYLRQTQSLRRLPLRALEAFGLRTALVRPTR